jgi:hypothetical protein
MKNRIQYKIILVIFIVGYCFPCGITAAEIEGTVLQHHISGWKLQHEHLDIFRIAFSRQHDERDYAYCVEENPYVQGEVRVKEWTFSWDDTEYTLDANHTSFVILPDEDNLAYEIIACTIHTTQPDSLRTFGHYP